ncbi:hypothetical protein, partial [Staphylococcus epidermidis]
NNQKNNKKDNFYIISIEIVFFYLSWDFMSHTLDCLNYIRLLNCYFSKYILYFLFLLIYYIYLINF